MTRARAIFTTVYNERHNLPIWHRYYSQFFNPSDMYVLDHASNPKACESMAGSGMNFRDIVGTYLDYVWYNKVVEDMQRELLAKYDLVVFCHTDELIIANRPEDHVGLPHRGVDIWMETAPVDVRDRWLAEPLGLGAILDSLYCDITFPDGYEIVHLAEEPRLDWSRKVLEQRRFWFRNEMNYAKPVICKVPCEWDNGFHDLKGGRKDNVGKPIDYRMTLVHLHRVDYETALAKRIEHATRQAGGQVHRDGTEVAFKSWFYKGTYGQPIVEIPKSVIDRADF